MKPTKILLLISLFACSQPCKPKYTDKEIDDSAKYWLSACLNNKFQPDVCLSLADRTVFEKRLENLEVMTKCMGDKQLD